MVKAKIIMLCDMVQKCIYKKLFKIITHGECNAKFLHCTWTSRWLHWDCDKLCIYKVIPGTTTASAIQRDSLKDNVDKSKWK